jgi:hypothetical protein
MDPQSIDEISHRAAEKQQWKFDQAEVKIQPVKSTQIGPVVGQTLYQQQFMGETIECTLFIVK